MTRNEALNYINANPDKYLERARRKGYICPTCGNGSGSDGTGIASRPDERPPHFTCFKGCFTSLSVFDVLAVKLGLDPTRMSGADFETVYHHCGLTVDSGMQIAARHSSLQANPVASPSESAYKPSNGVSDGGGYKSSTDDAKAVYAPSRALQDGYSEYMATCAARIEQTDYHRGIGIETLRRFRVGYDPAWRHPAAPNAPLSPRLIIPNDAGGFTARDTRRDEDIPAQSQKYIKQKVKPNGLFNTAALEADEPVFVCEGEFDAMSIEDINARAIGLGGVTNVDRFIEAAKLAKRQQPLILALDDDKDKAVNTGQDTAKKIATALAAAGIPFLQAAPTVFGNYKDANEALQADRAAFTAVVQRELEKAAAPMGENEATERETAINKREQWDAKYSAARQLGDFLGHIAANDPPIPMGFPELDRELDGGLYAGLYVIGALSSMGKTTLILQAADQMAASGRDVLIFSLEMSRYELIAKSISRLTCMKDTDRRWFMNAKTTRGITNFDRWGTYLPQVCTLIDDSIAEYKRIADKISIVEGIGDVTTETIRAKVDEFKAAHGGTAPVVIVDYLQILQPLDPRNTDKQATDRAVIELKRISRDNKIPVIAISSFNRGAYNNDRSSSMANFKESGAIEYSADVLLTLQAKSGAGEEAAQKEKAKVVRQMELKILKNRNGRTGGTINYDYRAMFNHFEEKGSISGRSN